MVNYIMEGYTHLFINSEEQFNLLPNIELDTIFNSFRSNKQCFSFIENGDIPPDNEAISVSKSIDEKLYNFFIQELVGRPSVGYIGSTSRFNNYNNLDSRHIMFSVIIWNFIKTPIRNILEIGGGYGNLLYINRNKEFDNWTIIDLPYISKLQSWFLNKMNINSLKYKLYSCYDYEEATYSKYDLVIGTHSISELSITTFNKYFASVIQHSRFLFYSYHKYAHKELVELKRHIIEEHFDLIFEVSTENNNVSTCLFKNKH